MSSSTRRHEKDSQSQIPSTVQPLSNWYIDNSLAVIHSANAVCSTEKSDKRYMSATTPTPLPPGKKATRLASPMQEMETYAERIRIQGNARGSKKRQTSADNVIQGECLEIMKVPDLGRWGDPRECCGGSKGAKPINQRGLSMYKSFSSSPSRIHLLP